MSKHTPGPWDVFGAQDSSSDEWRALTVAEASMPFMRVCFMPSDGTETIMANATLIAAAPELLELAKRLASECAECDGRGFVYGDDGVSGRGPDDVEPTRIACAECEDIRAVIAKATSHS